MHPRWKVFLLISLLIYGPQSVVSFLPPAVGKLGSFLRLIIDPYHVLEEPELVLDRAPDEVGVSLPNFALSQPSAETSSIDQSYYFDEDKIQLTYYGITQSVMYGDIPLLTGMDVSLAEGEPDEASGGIFFSFNFPLELPQHDAILGSLPPQAKLLTLSRIKRWWQAPSFPTSAGKVPVETQLLLVEIPSRIPNVDVEYAVIAPLIDFHSGFRSTLYGGAEEGFLPLSMPGQPQPHQGRDGRLTMRIESGNRQILTDKVDNALFVAMGSDPYELLERTYSVISKRMGTFRTRTEKRAPLGIDKLGACTWDTFYSGVNAESVKQALKSLAADGVPVKYVILDDGWQSTGLDKATAEGKNENGQTAEEVGDGDLSGAQIDGSLAADRMASRDNPVLALLTRGVSTFYTECVEKGDPRSPAVALWTWVAQGPLRNRLVHFFNEQTDFSKRLTSVVANSKFENKERGTSLKGFVRDLKENFSIEQVFCWHALGGYWGGVSEDIVRDLGDSDKLETLEAFLTNPYPLMSPSNTTSEGVKAAITTLYAAATPPPVTQNRFAAPTPHLLLIEPALAWDPSALIGVGSVAAHKLESLYASMHTYLADAGVDGVKVDAQAGLASFGGSSLVKECVTAVESSVKAAFTGVRNNLPEPAKVRSRQNGVLNCVKRWLDRAEEATEAVAQEATIGSPVHLVGCMCHSTDNLYNYMETTLIRASDDFYPRDSSAQSVHLVSCAYNSLMLGELAICDWDMFHSKHECAALHAAARAISGGPVYISDPVGCHDSALLRRLVLSDGRILRTTQPARPTIDCLFRDVMEDKHTALKVWSTNKVGGIVGAFNVQGSKWDQRKRRYVDIDGPSSVVARVKPCDAHAVFGKNKNKKERTRYVTWSAAKKEASVLSSVDSELALELKHRDWDLVTIQEVRELPVGTRPVKSDDKNWREGKTRKSLQSIGFTIIRGALGALPGRTRGRSTSTDRVEPPGLKLLGDRDKRSDRRSRGERKKRVAANISWAPIGLLDMLNCGGAVAAVLPQPNAHTVSMATVGEGEFGVYASQLPVSLSVEGKEVPFRYDTMAEGGFVVRFYLADWVVSAGEGRGPAERVIEIVF